MNIIEMRSVTKRFGGIVAVNNFSMDLPEFSTVGIIGPNGAGKTTIFNLISRITPVDSGSIKMYGTELTKLELEHLAKHGIGRTFQNIRLFNDLSVIDNVRAALDSSGKSTLPEAMLYLPRVWKEEKRIKEKARECLEIVDLLDYADERPSNLPYGVQRRLEIARAIALNPKVLMLDEPAAGLNPDEVQDLIVFIQKLKERFNLSVLIIEHKMDVIMELCDKIYVQDFGNTIAVGTPEEIQSDPKVIAAYLGGEQIC